MGLHVVVSHRDDLVFDPYRSNDLGSICILQVSRCYEKVLNDSTRTHEIDQTEDAQGYEGNAC
jgi:hypothetical protein